MRRPDDYPSSLGARRRAPMIPLKGAAFAAMEHTEPTSATSAREQAPAEIPRISSELLLCRARALEIEHDGKIYRLQLTRLGKLILTA